MREDALTQWQTNWFRCEYRIEDIPSNGLGTIPRIVAVPDSEFTWYEPVQDYGPKIIKSYWDRPGCAVPSSKKNKREDIPKRAHQPYDTEGDEWPAWLALSRLDIKSETAIRGFCSRYGLLGLREIPEWKEQCPLSESPRLVRVKYKGKHSKWYDVPAPKVKPANWHNKKLHCEPLELFRRATEQYQATVKRLVDINEGKITHERIIDPANADKIRWELCDIAMDAQWEGGLLLLDGCRPGISPRPVYDKDKISWVLGWQTRSLLDACRFSLILTLTQQDHAGLKRCARCNKPFLAETEQDVYCSIKHRKSGGVASIASRQVWGWLRKKLKAGEINKIAWKLAHAKTATLYKNGLKDKYQLQAKIEEYLKELS
jgi:hypothetical protein